MRVRATRNVGSLIPKSAVSVTSSLADAHAGCAPRRTLRTTDRAVSRDSSRPPPRIALYPGRLAARVAVRIVAVPHRLAETVFGCVRDELVALRRVAGDPVEDRADHLAGADALTEQCRVE